MIEPRCHFLKFFFCVLLAHLLANPVEAQVAPLIANIDGRQVRSLNGAWQVIVDPYDVGKLNYRAGPLDNNNAFFKNYKPQSKSELVEYDFDHSGQLNVPGDWNSQRESLLFYEGSVWYKQSFDYAKPAQGRLFLHFGAANYLADVYLNGEALGHHEGGFTPFDFEITDHVRPQGNFVVVRVNDRRENDRVPALTTDWWNYGGITRPVTLVEVPQTFIQDYVVQLDKGSTRNIKGWVQLNGPKLQQQVTIRIPEAGISKVFQTDSRGRVEISFDGKWRFGLLKTPSYIRLRLPVRQIALQRASDFVRLKRRARIFCSTERRFFCAESTSMKNLRCGPAAPGMRTMLERC